MRIAIRATAVALALQCGGSLTAGLLAQGAPGADTPDNRACSLLPDEVIDAATGLDYAAPELGPDGPTGNSFCLWGGATLVPGAARPQLGLALTKNVDAPFPAGPPLSGCAREALGGVGDNAYVEICRGYPSAQAYVKVGRNRLTLELHPEKGKPLASAKPTLVALAKAAALRAKGV